MKEHRTSLVLYTTAVCNLNCRYCFIDKNPALQKIDDFLDHSFLETPDYYFNFAKETFEQNKLTQVQFWGGEPFLGMHRAYETVAQMIEYFPNLREFLVSTNFVSHCFFDEAFGFFRMLGRFPERRFEFALQLSLDGPKNINDLNRGEGVTEKFTENFTKFITQLQDENNIPSNVVLRMHMKPTLDASSIAQLQTKEAVLEYFQFFETYQDTFNALNERSNVQYSLPIPNTACPSPHTQEEGFQFANYCKLTRLLEKENRENNKCHFKYYNYITSFQPRYKAPPCAAGLRGLCMGHCGNGRSTLGLLPNDMVSCCHNGFVDLLSEYKKNVLTNSDHMDDVTIEKGLFTNQRNSLIFKYDSKEFADYENQLEVFYNPQDTSKLTNIASLILLLANNGQIDEKYKDNVEAIQGAYFILNSTSYCVRDNLGVTGSIYMYPLGLLRLLLNGAREYIEMEE